MYLFFLLLLIFGYFSNNYLCVAAYRLTCRIPEKKTSSSLSVVHISDLHNKTFGHDQFWMIKKIRDLHPDLIVVTGDLVDGAPYRHAAVFLQQASRICPIYFVRGNHESAAGNFPSLKKVLSRYGVRVLKNCSADFCKDGYTYRITGLDDPRFRGKNKNYTALLQKTLNQMTCRTEEPHADYQILLTHRPELFSLYASYPFDLVLCGHAHGGQFRLPFTDGLYAPNQGIFPKYTSGAHTQNRTTEIISRGLGNSSFPLRLFNCPQIVHIQITINGR